MGVLDFLEQELVRKELEEEAEILSRSFRKFVLAAWPNLKPDEIYLHNWHIDAMCEYLEAVSRGEIKRLQVWVPPVSMKTLIVSILWPAWEWTHSPSIRYWGASYETRFSGRIAAMSRDLMMSDWYQERWDLQFIRDAEYYFTNSRGGTRLATSPESTGQGEHGHRILIDDPVNAREADATSGSVLGSTNNWYDGTVESRGIGNDHARIIVMQRLHQNDLAGHVLEKERWEVLCLPERFEHNHPQLWPRDPRNEGDLLWPEFRNETTSNALAAGMTSHRAAAQLQQRPAAREGEILLRSWWRFYDPKLLQDPARLPRFRAVVQTIDTPQKDKEANDLVAIQAWGVIGADRYLLDLKKGHMNFTQAKRAVLEQARYVRKMFPHAAHYCLIENAGYGVELIIELKRELTGVQKLSHQGEGDKILRAEAASSDLESGNCYLPGRRLGADELSMPDEKNCPADIVDFINSCALFPNATHDDDVDAWSQCMNWLRSRPIQKMRISSPFSRRRQDAARA